MRGNKVNVLKKMLGMILVAPVILSLSLFAAEVNYWTLDENVTDGTTYADSYNEANGTCVGAGCPTPSVGKINGAQYFDGEDDKISIDTMNTTNFEWSKDANITIQFWMMSEMIPTDNNNKVMIGRVTTGGILWYIGIDGKVANKLGHVRVAVANNKITPSNNVVDSGDINVTDGKWHNIAFVLTEPQIRVYVDGQSDFNLTRAATVSDLNVSSDVTLGSLNNFINLEYNGTLDDISLYNVALSAEEIKQNYDSIVLPPAPEPEPEPEPVPVPEPDTPIITDGGGGGCTYNPDSKNFDMMFLLMIALGLFYPFRRRLIK